MEVLAISCRLELIHVNQIYKHLGYKYNKPDASGARTEPILNGQAALTEEIVRKAVSILEPQKKNNLFKCFREHYLISPISGEEFSPIGWFHKNLNSKFLKLKPTADSRRLLAEAPSLSPSPSPSPALAPSPRSSGAKRSAPKRKAPPPVDGFSVPILIPESESDSTTDNGSNDHNRTTIVVAVVVTACVTFFAALIIFCCCRKAFGGGSKQEIKDDRPLLSLSSSDFTAHGIIHLKYSLQSSNFIYK